MHIDKFLEEQMIITGSMTDFHLVNLIYTEYVNWFNDIVDEYKGDVKEFNDFVGTLRKYPELYFVTKFSTVCIGIKFKQD